MLTHEPGPTRPQLRDPSTRWDRWTAGLVVVLVLATVAAVDPLGAQPFTTLRWAVIPGVVLAAGALVWRRRAVLPRAVVVPGVALLGWIVLAALAADDGLVPWLGHPRRHLGVLAWFVFAVAGVVGASLGPSGRRALGVTAVAGSGLLGVGAVLELIGVGLGGPPFPGARTGGFSGQPAYLGALAVLLVPVATAVAIGVRGRLRWLAWACVSLGVLGAVASQTRGALLALVVAAALGALRLARRSWVPAAAAAVVFVLALGVLASPLGGNVLSSIEGGHSRVTGRLDEWRVATSVIAEHPLLGVGPEGHRIAATSHLDDAYSARYGRDVVVDRAHDGLLDVAVVGGIPAGVLYTALLAVVGLRAWRARRARSPLVVGAAVAVLAYGVQQVVLFPLAEVDPLAWLLVGVVLAGDGPVRRTGELEAEDAAEEAGEDAGEGGPASGAAAPASPPAPAPASTPTKVISGALAVLAAATVLLGALELASDRRLAAAREQLAAGRTTAALASADRATELRPDSPDAWYVAARVASAGETLLDLDVALDRVASGLRRSPQDPALADLQERLLVERALRSGLAADHTAASAAVAQRLEVDPSNPLHHDLARRLDESRPAAVDGQR